MISTANYAARRFGVRSAMPGFIAKKLCPQLVFVDSDFAKYKHYASLTREVFKEYDPQFDAGSLDEAYLEISAYCAGKSMTPADVAEALRREVREKTKLTCSAGVAPTRRLAKVCSDANKPDGQMVIEPTRDAVAALLSSLPVRKIGGVGKVLDRTLAAFGIATCGDLLRERALVVALFSEVQSDFLLGVAIGVGGEARPARPPGWAPQRKSLSQERTFAPTADARALAAKIAALAEEVAAGLARENLLTRTVTLKMKRADFEVAQRQTSLPRPTNDAQTISDAALRLFRGEKNTHGSLRLLGVRASSLEIAGEPRGAPAAGQARIDASTFFQPAAAAAADISGDDDDAAATYACDACGGKRIREDDRAEHEDWHFAMTLQREERTTAISAAGPATRGGGGGGGGGRRDATAKRKRPKDQRSLLSMFDPKR